MPLRLIAYDDQSRADQARENILRLLREDGVDVLLGPYSSGLTMAVAPIAEEHKKILWNHGGTSDALFRQGWRFLVSVASPASDYLRCLPEWLKHQSDRFRRIVILQSAAGTFAAEVARGIIDAAQSLGFDPVEIIRFPSPLENVGSLIEDERVYGADALVIVGRFQDDITIIKQRRRFPVTVKALAAVAAGVQAFGDEVGTDAESVIGPSQWERTVEFGEILGPDAMWFISHFEKTTGQPPDYMAAQACALGIILAECIRRAGTLDEEKVRSAACELNLNTFFGRFRIDPASGRQIGHKPLLVRWHHGRKLIIWPQGHNADPPDSLMPINP